MCGIAGIYNFDGRPADLSILNGMLRKIERRGPDGHGTWSERSAALGHRRLAIRDLSAAGAQPFHSKCGNIVVSFNGEIYNDRELADELAMKTGFMRRTTCDTEVIPEAYLAWGKEFAEKLEGIFAIALYDRRTDRLILARDANGAKPLYVRNLPHGLQFASDTAAFRADPGYSGEWDDTSLNEMLALGYVGPDRSLFRDVVQITPGTTVCWDAENSEVTQFWRPQRLVNGNQTFEEAAGAIVSRLKNVVSDQVVADVPVAVLQSGGVDSTLISACLPQDCDAHLYTVRFNDRSHDESDMAKVVASQLKRPISFIDLGRTDVMRDFRSMVRSTDGALADSSALATFQLSRAVRRHAKVALSGDGADEYFAGYPTYRATAIASRLGSLLPFLPLQMLSTLARAVSRPSRKRIGATELLSRLLDGLASTAPHANWRRYLREADKSLLYGGKLGDRIETNPLAAYADAGLDGEDAWDQALLADQRFYLPGDMLVKTDRTSMYHGLEVRVPFLDRRMCDLASSIRRSHMVDARGNKKAVLRHALAKLGFPKDIFAGPKHGFNIPMNALLANELKPLGDHLLDRNPDILEPYLAADGVRRFWREHRDGKRDHRFVIWTLLVLAAWKEDYSAT